MAKVLFLMTSQVFALERGPLGPLNENRRSQSQNRNRILAASSVDD
jgi:hypothetical protein